MCEYKPRCGGGEMRPKAYRVLADAVERGVRYGWHRAHKHTDEPDENAAVDEIYKYVMGEICDSFDFDDDGAGDKNG